MFELFSVIKDGVEIGTVGSHKDAQALSPDTTFVFLDKPKPQNVSYKTWDEEIQSVGYYIDKNDI